MTINKVEKVKIDMTSSNLTQGTNDYFGRSVAIFNNKVYIGANGHDGAKGAVCVYDLAGTFEFSIQASDKAGNDNFGYSVAAGSNKVAIGAYGVTSSTGAVYVYDAANGANQVKFSHTSPSTNDLFGYCVTIGDSKIGVSSPQVDVGGVANRGSAWIFDLDGTNEVEFTPVAGRSDDSSDFFGSSISISGGKVAGFIFVINLKIFSHFK